MDWSRAGFQHWRWTLRTWAETRSTLGRRAGCVEGVQCRCIGSRGDQLHSIDRWLEALSSAQDASLSIGALTVQPQGTGVILAGTGDPNNVSDSYYGGGILRSADGGQTWSVTQRTSDLGNNCAGTQAYSFVGEGFGGFAWSSTNPQLVVAAVSSANEGTLVNAQWPGVSYEGLYYSTDAGVCWNLATITDGAGTDVQGPMTGSRRRTAMEPRRLCGIRCGRCSLRRFDSTVLPVLRWRDMDTDRSTTGRRADSVVLPYQSAANRLNRLPNLSRNAGG